MMAINRTTIRDNFKKTERIGETPVKDEYLEFALEVEQWLESRNAPLPVTFDVAHCQPPFYSEYTYSDFAGGIWVRSLSAEFNSRYFQALFQQDLPKDNVWPVDHRAEGSMTKIPWREKYDLKHTGRESKAEKNNHNIIFLAGTNLFQNIAWEIVDREIYSFDKTLIKPHPLTNDDGLKKLSKRYGWHRIIDLNDSGYYWYSQAETISTTANSELFVRSIIDGKLKECLTKISTIAKASYFPFFRMSQLVDYGKEIEEEILNPWSGFVFPQQQWKTRLKAYFETTMDFRKRWRSDVPLFVGDFQ